MNILKSILNVLKFGGIALIASFFISMIVSLPAWYFYGNGISDLIGVSMFAFTMSWIFSVIVGLIVAYDEITSR